jgi:hypothetical protein
MGALTREVLFGFNLMTLIGFVLMGIGINQSRQGRSRAPIAFTLMGVGTALVFLGFYLDQPTS